MGRHLTILTLLVSLGACGQPSTPSEPASSENADNASAESAPDKPGADEAPPERPPRIGMLMIETGHRFEMAGRARLAGRWELAAYEVGEIAEMFEADVSRAYLPGACTDAVSEAMFGQLLDHQLPALKEAAERRDPALFAERFREASGSCNACHATCAAGFIQVPDEPGVAIPRLEPVDETQEATAVHAEPEQAPNGATAP